MEPTYALSDEERCALQVTLAAIEGNPYKDYLFFSRSVTKVITGVPDFMRGVCDQIQAERQEGESDIHVLRNCPIDAEVPELDLDDPLADKYKKKLTFVAEAFLELFAQLTGTPLLAYATRFNGDFFIDVIAHNRYRGQQTGYSDGELVYHNDRTPHRIRADFIYLLGMRCPPDLVYTSFVGGRDLLAQLSPAEQRTLRLPYFVTPFDVFSRDNNNQLTSSGTHPILENDHSFRYLDTHTTAAPGAPVAAKDALIAIKNALTRAEKKRHRMQAGDLLTFANQDGLHSRERPEVTDEERARHRWLLKTYAFRDQARAQRFTADWVDGVAGRVGD